MYLRFFFLTILFFYTQGLIPDERILQKRNPVNSEDVGTPLFLTPLLERKGIAEAREKARVRHSEIKNVESYSGYFTVNKKYNSNLFFWYFPSKGNSSTDPLILWLQGGPGVTTLVGIFNENGPFEVSETNKLELRNITWINNHNLLYIDSPVGTGFSFTDNEADYAFSINNVTHNLYIALQQFFELFPELRKNQFYVMGESYGGKYVPALSYAIHKANQNNNTQNKINLVGLAIGNGWTDPINQLEYSRYLYEIGLIDENGKEQMRKVETQITNLMETGNYFEACKMLISRIIDYRMSGLISTLTGFKYYNNYLYNEEPKVHHFYGKWVQQSSVRKALHVGHRQFSPSSFTVFGYMAHDFMKSAAEFVEILLENYRVLLYYGQLDILCAYPNAEKYVKQLDWSGAEEYKKSVRNLWFVENQLAGYTKSVGNLNVVLVRNAGHMVPADQPLWAWNMITHFTRHKSL